jgi:hypothetical protein
MTSKLGTVNRTVAGVVGGITGVLSFINTSTSKDVAQGSSFTTRAIYASSHVLGPDLTWGVLGGGNAGSITINGVTIMKSQLPAQTINPYGALNNTTYAGVALLIIDYVIKEAIGSKYGMSYAHPWLQSIGAGLVFGGVFGGTFDPGTGVRGGATSGSGPIAIGAVGRGRQGGSGSRIIGFAGTYSG